MHLNFFHFVSGYYSIISVSNTTMRSFLAVIFMLANTQFAGAQTFTWAGKMDATRPRSVHVDPDGNVFTTGRFSGTVDFDPGSGVTNLNAVGASEGIYVQKLDATGNLVWAKHMAGSINGEGFTVTTDDLSNVYVIGYFRGTVDFDPGPGTAILTTPTPPFYDLFILKLDAAGNLVWVKQLINLYDGTPHASIVVDDDGNVYCAGFFKGTVDFDPGVSNYPVSAGDSYVGFILKLTTSGAFSWVRIFNTTSIVAGLTTDGDHVYVTGYFLGTLAPDQDAPATVYISKGSADSFVLKYAADGKFVWGRHMGGPGDDYGRSLTLDNTGNLILGGEFQQTAEFNIGGTSTMLTSAGQLDVFLQKFDVSGNFVWVKQIGGTEYEALQKISISSTGNLYVAGQFAGTASFNIGTTPEIFTTSGSVSFMLKINPSEEIDWMISYPAHQLFMAVEGDFTYAAGVFFSTIDFDPGSGSYPLTAGGIGSAFILKLNNEVITGVEDIETGFSVYPNPVRSIAILDIEKNATQKFKVRVIDMQRNVVGEQIIAGGTGTQIDMTGLSTGSYILEITNPDNKVRVIRLIKN